MKHKAHYLPILAVCLLPVLSLIAMLAGRTVQLREIPYSLLLVAAMVYALFAAVKKRPVPRLLAIAALILTPVNFILCFLQGTLPTLAAFLCGCSAMLLAVIGIRNKTKKIVAGIYAVLIALPMVYLCFLGAIFGYIGETVVVQTIQSPDAAYTAELIDSDQGGLGGNTLVYVFKNKAEIDLGICKLVPRRTEIYRGQWHEFKTMKLAWKDENTLLINGKAYEIP